MIKQWWLIYNHHHCKLEWLLWCIPLRGNQKLLLTLPAEMVCFQLFFVPLLYTIQNILDSKLCAQKCECQREGAEKNTTFCTFLIHKMNVLTRFDSSIVSESLCFMCVWLLKSFLNIEASDTLFEL